MKRACKLGCVAAALGLAALVNSFDVQIEQPFRLNRNAKPDSAGPVIQDTKYFLDLYLFKIPLATWRDVKYPYNRNWGFSGWADSEGGVEVKEHPDEERIGYHSIVTIGEGRKTYAKGRPATFIERFISYVRANLL